MAAFVLGVFLFWVALYLYLPTLPLYVQTKTGSLATVGLILGQYGLWLAIARVRQAEGLIAPQGAVSLW